VYGSSSADTAAAYVTFVQRHAAAWGKLAYLLARDRPNADDVLQDVLLELWRRWPHISQARSPDAYVKRMIINRNAKVAGYASRQRQMTTSLLVEPPPDEHRQGVVDEPTWEAFARLKPRQRAVLILRYLEDRSDEEIAAILGTSRATVRSLAARGLSGIRASVSSRTTSNGTT